MSHDRNLLESEIRIVFNRKYVRLLLLLLLLLVVVVVIVVYFGKNLLSTEFVCVLFIMVVFVCGLCL